MLLPHLSIFRANSGSWPLHARLAADLLRTAKIVVTYATANDALKFMFRPRQPLGPVLSQEAADNAIIRHTVQHPDKRRGQYGSACL
jgi:hypothetical protein